MTQGKSLYGYLKQTKMSFFFLLPNWRTGGQNGTLVPVRGGRGRSVGGRIWCKYCVYMYVNGKMRPVETIPGVEGRGDKGKWWRE
jgi:hypothetical protein